MGEISSYALNWNGDKVLANVREATKWGMDSVMADCVITAMGNHPYQDRTGILTGSIKMEPAKDDGVNVTGYWGSWEAKYAQWVEFGTLPHMPPVSAIAGSMKISMAEAWPIALAIARNGTRPYPFLIPASERHYPSLSLRIRAKLEWA